MSESLKEVCARHRKFARQLPVIPELISVEGYREYLVEHPLEARDLSYLEFLYEIMRPYSFKYGKYFVEITLRAPGVWHAQVSILEEIGELEFGAPKEALLALVSWTDRDFVEAREILGEALGDEILRPTQKVTEHEGQMSLHWMTEDERNRDGARAEAQEKN